MRVDVSPTKDVFMTKADSWILSSSEYFVPLGCKQASYLFSETERKEGS